MNSGVRPGTTLVVKSSLLRYALACSASGMEWGAVTAPRRMRSTPFSPKCPPRPREQRSEPPSRERNTLPMPGGARGQTPRPARTSRPLAHSGAPGYAGCPDPRGRAPGGRSRGPARPHHRTDPGSRTRHSRQERLDRFRQNTGSVDSERLFRGGFEDVEREGRGDGPVVGTAPRPAPLRPCWSSCMVGRRLACRDAAGSRARHLTRQIVPQPARSSLNPRARLLEVRARGLSDDLAGWGTISRVE